MSRSPSIAFQPSPPPVQSALIRQSISAGWVVLYAGWLRTTRNSPSNRLRASGSCPVISTASSMP